MSAPVVVGYGPFPLRARPIALGAAAFIVALGLVLLLGVASSARALVCARPGRCELHRGSPLFGDRSVEPFASDDIADVRLTRTNSKGSQTALELIDTRGTAIRVADHRDADAGYALAQAFFVAKSTSELTIVNRPDWWIIAGAAALALLALAGMLSPLRQRARFRITVDRARGELAVSGSLFGIRFGARRYALAAVTAVTAETLPDRWARPNAEDRLGRLALSSAGAILPLTRGFYRDQAARDDVRRELEAALGLSVTPPSAHSPEPARPLVVASRSWRTPLLVTVVASAAGVLAVVAQLVTNGNARGQGLVEVHAEYRCRAEGMELSPGGVVQLRHDPGTMLVEVWNPAHAGKWEPIRVVVEADKTTTLACRPGLGEVRP